MAERIPKSTALRVVFQAYLAADHVTPATGKTIAVTLSKNGAAYGNPAIGATNATEIGSGSYYVDLSATDTNTAGPLVIKATAGTIDPVYIPYDVVATAAALAPVAAAFAPTGTIFLNSVDIGNRACDHCGQDPIDATLGFTEVSKKAALFGRIYPKLRQAELRRNVWRFSIRKAALRAIDSDTMLLAASMWVSTTTYFVGSIVSDEYNQLWISRIPNNLGYEPQNSSVWEQYFGPITVALYDDTTAYQAGELVYKTDGDGTSRVYLSRESGNEDDPETATAWSASTTYKKNQVVTYSSVAYMSLIDLNLNNTPSSSPAPWASGTTYAAGAAVAGSDGIKYTSVGSGNIGHDPTTDGGTNWTDTGDLVPWKTSFVAGAGSIKWLQIGGAEFPMGVGLAELNIIYPLGTGPSSQVESRNIYRLPAGFLRQAPQDPKAGSNSYLGAETGLVYTDWLFEGPYIVTRDVGPIMFRFVADTVDVSAMDPMFCEGLAARMGLEGCEPLTQSNEKLKTIASIYQQHMTEARLVNAVEIGSEEPPIDDFIACRV